MSDLVVKRFLKTAALLDSDNEHERSAAARQATAMLREVGLDWTTVLEAGLTKLGHAGVENVAGAGKLDDFWQDLFKPKASRAAQAAKVHITAAINDIFAEAVKGYNKVMPPAASHDPLVEALGNSINGTDQAGQSGLKPRRTLSGRSIPFHVLGVPRLVERREARLNLVVFYMDTQAASYGPLVAFEHIEMLTQAMNDGTSLSGHVRQPVDANQLPKFVLSPHS